MDNMKIIISLFITIFCILMMQTEHQVLGQAHLIEITKCNETKCIVKYQFNNTTFSVMQNNPKIGDLCSYQINKAKYLTIGSHLEFYCDDKIIKNADSLDLSDSSPDLDINSFMPPPS